MIQLWWKDGRTNEEPYYLTCNAYNATIFWERMMSIKRSELLKLIAGDTVVGNAEAVLDLIEKYMEPRIRPLTDKEVEEHVLVKQVHHSKRDEVRVYVKNLDYEWKREYIPEED